MLTDLSLHEGEPELWARIHFGKVELGNFSRNRRVETIAAAMATNPGVLTGLTHQPGASGCSGEERLAAMVQSGWPGIGRLLYPRLLG